MSYKKFQLEKMGHTLKKCVTENWVKLKKYITLGKINDTLKRVSQLEKGVTLKKKCHTKKIVSNLKIGHI